MNSSGEERCALQFNCLRGNDHDTPGNDAECAGTTHISTAKRCLRFTVPPWFPNWPETDNTDEDSPSVDPVDECVVEVRANAVRFGFGHLYIYFRDANGFGWIARGQAENATPIFDPGEVVAEYSRDWRSRDQGLQP